MITPTAMSMTLPRMANSLNSFSMVASFRTDGWSRVLARSAGNGKWRGSEGAPGHLDGPLDRGAGLSRVAADDDPADLDRQPHGDGRHHRWGGRRARATRGNLLPQDAGELVDECDVCFAAEGRATFEQQPCAVAVLLPELRGGLQTERDVVPIAEALAQLAEPALDHLPCGMPGDGLVDVALVLEVEIERPGADVGGRSHLRRGSGVEATLEKDLQRSGKQALARLALASPSSGFGPSDWR